MQQTNGSLLHSKRQILQKDLSFSNEIFKRSFNYQNIHSSKSSHQNLTKNNNIPPLIKYTESIQTQNIHYEQNYQNTNNTQTSLTDRKQKHNNEDKNQQFVQQQQKQQLSIFQRKSKPNLNVFTNKSAHKQQKYSSIPSLSKLQEKIAKKYQKQQNSNQQEKQPNKPTTVYFDNTQSYQNQPLNSSRHKILNIESLQQSRIANHSIERHNNWIINNIGDNSGFFQDNNTILSNLSKKSLNKKNINRSLINNSFRNMNPLQLVNNSLYLSHLPQFVEDDQISQQNNIQQRDKENDNEKNIKTIQQKLRVFNTVNKNQQINANNNKQREQIREVNFKKLTMDLYQYYVVPHFGNKNNNQYQTSSIPDSILINDFEPQTNKGFDLLTTKSTPIHHNQSKNSPYIENYKTISQINQHLYIEQNSFEQSHSNFRNTKGQQHFLNDKSPQQIISAILSDPNKMKLYIKYLQLKIALNNNNNQILNVNQTYQLLSCILIKINQITDKNLSSNLYNTKTLAESILDLGQYKHHKQKNLSYKQKEINNNNNNNKPQIIRSPNAIKINFDPYLTYQTDKINSKISYLKKCLQEKNKQSQLIKLNYDSIIHNYATTLQNLAKNNQNNKRIEQNQQSQQNQQLQESSNRKSQHQSQRFQQKNYLQINNNKNRSSFQQNKIHRKATFGKVPSSFKGSDIAYY